MPPKCQKCGNVIKAKGGACLVCDDGNTEAVAGNGAQTSCAACSRLTTGICALCLEKRKQEVRDQGRDIVMDRTRSKSPLVNSAERPGKVPRADISTPLEKVPPFPKIPPEEDDPPAPPAPIRKPHFERLRITSLKNRNDECEN